MASIGQTSASKPSTSTAEHRPHLTPARKQIAENKSGNEVVITIDKLIALVIHLINTSGGLINATNIKSCIDGALQFLGVSIQFCAAKPS